MLGLDLYPINWQWGNVGEVAGAAATFGALLFAWRQIRAERSETRESIQVAKDALRFEQRRAAEEREERARERVAGMSMYIETQRLAVRTTTTRETDVVIKAHNLSSLPCFHVVGFLLVDNELKRSPFELFVHPGGHADLQVGRFELDSDRVVMGGITFRSAEGAYWMKLANGRLERWDQDPTALANLVRLVDAERQARRAQLSPSDVQRQVDTPRLS